jgi:hypothetical protein
MGLLDGLTPTTRPQLCKVRDVAESLDASDSKIFLDAVMNEKWTVHALTGELNKRGVFISGSPIHRHRTKACSCWKA